MPAVRTLTLFLLLALAAPPAQAQPSTLDPEAIKSSLEQFLSIVTFGTLMVRDQGAEVTRSGANYQIRLPLDGFLGASGRRRQCGRPPDRAGVAGRHVNDIPAGRDN